MDILSQKSFPIWKVREEFEKFVINAFVRRPARKPFPVEKPFPLDKSFPYRGRVSLTVKGFPVREEFP